MSFDDIHESKVYTFEKLFTRDWPKFKPYQLQMKKDSKMTLMPDEEERFSEIGYIDGTFQGTIVGFEEILDYGSCLQCNSKVSAPDDKKCSRCNFEFDSAQFDFKFEMMMESNCKLQTFTGFKRNLPDHEDLGLSFATSSQVSVTLNNTYNDTKASITYTKELVEGGEENFIIQEMESI